MTIETLFGKEQALTKPRTIKLKKIRAVYEKMVIKEEIHRYLQPFTRYNSPEQVRKAQHETLTINATANRKEAQDEI